jgi:hypothetical protein
MAAVVVGVSVVAGGGRPVERSEDIAGSFRDKAEQRSAPVSTMTDARSHGTLNVASFC